MTQSALQRCTCPCGKATVTFDPVEARSIRESAEDQDAASHEIRKRWPRHCCDECNVIQYASWAHYIAGDW